MDEYLHIHDLKVCIAIHPGKSIICPSFTKFTLSINYYIKHFLFIVFQEATLCVRELESPKNINVFVYNALSHVLERSSQARLRTGEFLHELIKIKVLTVDQYIQG